MSSRPMSAAAATADDRPAPSEIWRRGALAAGIAVAANVVVWAIGRGLLGVNGDFWPLATPFPAIFSTVFGVLVGTAVFVLLARFTQRPVPIFRVVAVVFGLLSLTGPPGQRSEEGGDWTAALVLMAMHVVAAAVAIVVLTGIWRPRPR